MKYKFLLIKFSILSKYSLHLFENVPIYLFPISLLCKEKFTTSQYRIFSITTRIFSLKGAKMK
jgi:hypothetical protein